MINSTDPVLPEGIVGQAYNQTFMDSIGTGPLDFSVIADPRPAGSSLPLLEGIRPPFIEKTGRPTCHNNSPPTMAAVLTREHDFKLNERTAIKESEPPRHSECWAREVVVMALSKF